MATIHNGKPVSVLGRTPEQQDRRTWTWVALTFMLAVQAALPQLQIAFPKVAWLPALGPSLVTAIMAWQNYVQRADITQANLTTTVDPAQQAADTEKPEMQHAQTVADLIAKHYEIEDPLGGDEAKQ